MVAGSGLLFFTLRNHKVIVAMAVLLLVAFVNIIKLHSFSIVLFLSSFGLLFCRNVYIRYADSLVSHGCQLLHRFAIILSEEWAFLCFEMLIMLSLSLTLSAPQVFPNV